MLVSLRLKPEEYAHLKTTAKAQSISAYIRARLFDSTDEPAASERLSPAARQRMLAQILARLGQSDMRRSLTDLAEAARLGALPLTPDVLADIHGACAAIMEMRTALIRALGLKPAGGDCRDS